MSTAVPTPTHLLKILVVDDQPGVCTALTEILELAGHEVVCTTDGRLALTLLGTTARDSDLVIADLVMPNLDGIGLILEMNQRYPRIPVIAISGGGQGDASLYLKTAKALGAVAVVKKPFSIDVILAAVEAAAKARPR